MNKKKLLQKIVSGSYRNISFNDFVTLVQSFGFEFVRQKGSHQIFWNKEVGELLNLQNVGGEVKPYQVRDFIKIVEENNLQLS
ncbi:MAG: type II toxin-antitoxin system HicA family toxin [Cytophagales bacterium]|nr:type II toxin-antitoxin system HicA family toxin [Cytophagales bacterium]